MRDEERFTAWMFQIARNAITDAGRARRPALVGAAAVDARPAPTPAEDEREAATALAGCVSLFVAALPSPYREAVTVVELEGRTAREAAALVGISSSGMKARVQRGRAQLRDRFEACCEIAVDARGTPIEFTPRCAVTGCALPAGAPPRR